MNNNDRPILAYLKLPNNLNNLNNLKINNNEKYNKKVEIIETDLISRNKYWSRTNKKQIELTYNKNNINENIKKHKKENNKNNHHEIKNNIKNNIKKNGISTTSNKNKKTIDLLNRIPLYKVDTPYKKIIQHIKNNDTGINIKNILLDIHQQYELCIHFTNITINGIIEIKNKFFSIEQKIIPNYDNKIYFENYLNSININIKFSRFIENSKLKILKLYISKTTHKQINKYKMHTLPIIIMEKDNSNVNKRIITLKNKVDIIIYDEKYYHPIKKNNSTDIAYIINLLSAHPTESYTIKDNIYQKKNFINYYFDKIFVINLKKDTIKRSNIIKSFSQYNINFEFIDAIYGYDEPYASKYKIYKNNDTNDRHLICSEGAWGYLETWKMILESCIKHNYFRILCFDDDVILKDDFMNKFINFAQTIDQVNPNWKIINLGASEYNWSNISIKSATDAGWYHPVTTDGSFAIGISNQVYSIILKELEKFDCSFDSGAIKHIYKMYPKDNFIAFPNIAIADLFLGEINKRKDPLVHMKLLKWI